MTRGACSVLLGAVSGMAAGCTPDAARTERADNPHALYHLPSGPTGLEGDGTGAVVIARDGQITFEGKPVSLGELPALLEDAPTDHWSGPTFVSPSADAPFANVLPVIAAIEEANRIGSAALDLPLHTEVAGWPNPNGSVPAGSRFEGEPLRFEYPVFVSLAADGETCVAVVGHNAVPLTALYDQAFDKLDFDVQDAGGIEAVLRDREIFDAMQAVLQVRGDTPWRCVAAPADALAMAGYPAIRFEIVD